MHKATLRSLAALVPAAVAPGAVAVQARPLALGGITAAPGEKAAGFLEVLAAAESGTRTPVTLIHGSSPGPALALVAGVD